MKSGFTVAILLFDRITALDAVGPYEVLTRVPEAEVTFVASEPGAKWTGDERLALVADTAVDALQTPDVVVVPGGPGISSLIGNPDLLAWLRNAHESSRWTASVCTGSLLLAAAGILGGRRATTHWSALDDLRALGATPVSDRIVRDGRTITSAGVSAGIDMALYLAGEMAGKEVAQAIQLMIEYRPEPPFDGGSIATASESIIAEAERLGRRRRPPRRHLNVPGSGQKSY